MSALIPPDPTPPPLPPPPPATTPSALARARAATTTTTTTSELIEDVEIDAVNYFVSSGHATINKSIAKSAFDPDTDYAFTKVSAMLQNFFASAFPDSDDAEWRHSLHLPVVRGRIVEYATALYEVCLRNLLSPSPILASIFKGNFKILKNSVLLYRGIHPPPNEGIAGISFPQMSLAFVSFTWHPVVAFTFKLAECCNLRLSVRSPLPCIDVGGVKGAKEISPEYEVIISPSVVYRLDKRVEAKIIDFAKQTQLSVARLDKGPTQFKGYTLKKVHNVIVDTMNNTKLNYHDELEKFVTYALEALDAVEADRVDVLAAVLELTPSMTVICFGTLLVCNFDPNIQFRATMLHGLTTFAASLTTSFQPFFDITAEVGSTVERTRERLARGASAKLKEWTGDEADVAKMLDMIDIPVDLRPERSELLELLFDRLAKEAEASLKKGGEFLGTDHIVARLKYEFAKGILQRNPKSFHHLHDVLADKRMLRSFANTPQLGDPLSLVARRSAAEKQLFEEYMATHASANRKAIKTSKVKFKETKPV